jgi:hypothetical protein
MQADKSVLCAQALGVAPREHKATASILAANKAFKRPSRRLFEKVNGMSWCIGGDERD